MFSEQDVDRELKTALSVSPSPDFEARVLQRVEADRPSRWPAHYGWLAAAASLVLVASVFYALNRASPAVAEPPAPQIVEHPGPPVEMPRHEAPAGTNTIEPPRIQTVRASVGYLPAPRSAEPEVLVAPDQMDAVRRLVRAANEGRVVEAPAEPALEPMAPPATVGITPLAVEPIPLSPLGPATETATPSIRGIK
jgi:hypothetical protein